MKRLFLLLSAVPLLGCAAGQPPPPGSTPPGVTPLLQQVLPVDLEVQVGRLDNGLRYYIRANRKPERRAELRLVVDAGSVLEEDQQQGLAHFVEHMAFNGTAHFAKQELVDYLESIGMRFGPDLNAYTGFDETVYMLQVPTDSAAVVEKAFQILQDWAGGMSMDDQEIDKERGVVIEEWRLGRGADARLRDRQLPVLLKDSRYALRLPIGQKAVLDTFSHESLRRFYRTWYRPDLMALVAVGDFDPQWIEALVRRYGGQIPAATAPPARPSYPVPDHPRSLVTVASDPEVTSSSVAVYCKREVREQQTVGAYRRYLVEALYHRLLNQRLYELTVGSTPPFLSAHSGSHRLVRTKEGVLLTAQVEQNGIERGLAALVTEARRVQLHGFTASELERQKKEMLRSMEQAYRERDKTESQRFAAEYIRNFLEDEPMPGIEYEKGMYQTFLPQISLEEVDRQARETSGPANQVVLADTPEKEGVRIPTPDELATVLAQVEGASPEPYVDELAEVPLLANPPAPRGVVAAAAIPELGLLEWRLGNGVRVVLRPTDFQNDEVLFTAYSPGGTSLVPDSLYVAASTADDVVQEGGAGVFDQIALRKKLAGQVVRVSPWISELQEGMSGSASPQDLETLFQLIYLYATAPRPDSTAFEAYRKWMRGMIQNRGASPENAFADTLQVTLAQHHFRARPWSEAMLGELDLGKSVRIYQERFADAGDFTFIFVGNFTLEQIQPLVEQYLGGLPATGRQESWVDPGIRPPVGRMDRQVHRGLEAKSYVQLVFTGPFPWSVENAYLLHSLAGVLRIKLREVLREDLGGTYGVTVRAVPAHYPRPEYSFAVGFGCAPERVSELTRVVFAQLDSVRQTGVGKVYVAKLQEMQRRQRQVDLEKNNFWLEALKAAYVDGTDPRVILRYEELVEKLDSRSLQEMAQRCLREENHVRVVLYPKEEQEK